MRRACFSLGICLSAITVSTSPALAAEGLTLEAATSRARERSPATLAAHRRLDEARARERSLAPLRDNPEIEGAFGHRSDGQPPDFEVGLRQTLAVGGAQGARTALARSEVARETASLADSQRTAAHEAASVFLRGLQVEERIATAEAAERFSADLLGIAERRHQAGDVAALDVNTATSALGRARAEVKSARAERAEALGDLRVLLALPPDEPLSLVGRLDDLRPGALGALLATAGERPDLKVLEAELAGAEAEVRSGRAGAWPELTPAIRYERDSGTGILWGGVTVRVPLFERGQERRAVGQVRAERVRQEIAARRAAIATRVQSLHESWSLRSAAADDLKPALVAMDDSEQLAARSYEVGQIGLGELLMVRRDAAETRRTWHEARLAAAQARYALESEAGVSR